VNAKRGARGKKGRCINNTVGVVFFRSVDNVWVASYWYDNSYDNIVMLSTELSTTSTYRYFC